MANSLTRTTYFWASSAVRFIGDVVGCSQQPHLFRADLFPKPKDGSQN
jgi:hypothetical protein